MIYLRDNYLSTEICNTFIRIKYGILVVIIFMIFFMISINVEVISGFHYSHGEEIRVI